MREKREYGKNVSYLISQPEPPKKALSSFLLYRAEVFERVKAMNPGLRITELTMIISEMWAQADQETKSRLQQEHEKNKIITAYEKEEYEKMYGFVEKKRRNKRKRRDPKDKSSRGYSGSNYTDNDYYDRFSRLDRYDPEDDIREFE